MSDIEVRILELKEQVTHLEVARNDLQMQMQAQLQVKQQAVEKRRSQARLLEAVPVGASVCRNTRSAGTRSFGAFLARCDHMVAFASPTFSDGVSGLGFEPWL